jgi:hypothetical protein
MIDMKKIIIGGVVYNTEDLIELLEDRLHSNTETGAEYEFYVEYRRIGEEVFLDKKHKKVILRLIGGVTAWEEWE